MTYKPWILTLFIIFIIKVECSSYTYHYCAKSCGDFSEQPTYCCGHDYNYKNGKCASVRQHTADLKYYSDKYSAWRVDDDTRNRRYFGICCAKHNKNYCKFTNNKKGSWKKEVNYWIDTADKTVKVVSEILELKK